MSKTIIDMGKTLGSATNTLICGKGVEGAIVKWANDLAGESETPLVSVGNFCGIELVVFDDVPDDKAYLVPKSALPRFLALHRKIKPPIFDSGAIDFADLVGIKVPVWIRLASGGPPPPVSKWRLKLRLFISRLNLFVIWPLKKRVRQSRQTK